MSEPHTNAKIFTNKYIYEPKYKIATNKVVLQYITNVAIAFWVSIRCAKVENNDTMRKA